MKRRAIGHTKCEIAPYSYFSDHGLLSRELTAKFEEFDEMIYDYAETQDESPVDEARRLLAPLYLAYALKAELNTVKDYHIFEQFAQTLTGRFEFVRASGHALRRARTLVIEQLLSSGADELRYDTELSSSHGLVSSSPGKPAC